MKKREFWNFRQGGRTVGKYVDDFSKLFVVPMFQQELWP